jgi:hypothetical protein
MTALVLADIDDLHSRHGRHRADIEGMYGFEMIELADSRT